MNVKSLVDAPAALLASLDNPDTKIFPAHGDNAPIQTLPEELLHMVFANTRPSDIPAIKLTCKHFRRLVRDEILYKNWCKEILSKYGKSMPADRGNWSCLQLLNQALSMDRLTLKKKSFINTNYGSLFYGEFYHVDNLLILGSPISKFIEVYDIDTQLFQFRKDGVSEVLGNRGSHLYFNGGLQRSELYILDLSSREYLVHVKPDGLEPLLKKRVPQFNANELQHAIYTPIRDCIILKDENQFVLVNANGTVSYWDVAEPSAPKCTLCFQIFDTLTGTFPQIYKLMKCCNHLLIHGYSNQEQYFVKVYPLGSAECTDRFLLENSFADIIANDVVTVRFGTHHVTGYMIDDSGKFKEVWRKTETRTIHHEEHFLDSRNNWLFYYCEDSEEPGENNELLKILNAANGREVGSAENTPDRYPIADRQFQLKYHVYLLSDNMLLCCSPNEKGAEIKLWGIPTMIMKTVKCEDGVPELYGIWNKGRFLGSPIGYEVNSAKIPIFSFV